MTTDEDVSNDPIAQSIMLRQKSGGLYSIIPLAECVKRNYKVHACPKHPNISSNTKIDLRVDHIRAVINIQKLLLRKKVELPKLLERHSIC